MPPRWLHAQDSRSGRDHAVVQRLVFHHQLIASPCLLALWLGGLVSDGQTPHASATQVPLVRFLSRNRDTRPLTDIVVLFLILLDIVEA